MSRTWLVVNKTRKEVALADSHMTNLSEIFRLKGWSLDDDIWFTHGDTVLGEETNDWGY